MKILIIEDEKRAANRLERMLLEIDSSISIVGVVPSVTQGITYFNTHSEPDLILSDIQLEDGISFEIFEKSIISCPIIFTTAYNQYAIQAFKVNGIDYLLKPIDEGELKIAIEKFKKLFAKKQDIPNQAEMIAAIARSLKTDSFKTRFMIKVGTKIKTIETSEIACFYSQNKGTYLQTTQGRNYDIDYTVENLSEMVDPKKFFRISRKYLVNINGIEEITAWSNSRLKLNLKGSSDENIIVARERTKEFKEWLGG